MKIKLIIQAGKATPGPPIGPALGSKGIKAMDFCKEFNQKTEHYEPTVPIPCIVKINPDKSYTYVVKSPPTSWLLKKAANIEKGSSKPGHEIAGVISLKHIYEIAKVKQTDENHKNLTLKSICSMIISVASLVGLKVVK